VGHHDTDSVQELNPWILFAYNFTVMQVSKFRSNTAEDLDHSVSSFHNKTQSLTLYRLHFPKLYTSPIYVYAREGRGNLRAFKAAVFLLFPLTLSFSFYLDTNFLDFLLPLHNRWDTVVDFVMYINYRPVSLFAIFVRSSNLVTACFSVSPSS
jgi:hypothetical protein